MHIDNKRKDMFIFSKEPTDGLDDASLTAEKRVLSVLLSSREKVA